MNSFELANRKLSKRHEAKERTTMRRWIRKHGATPAGPLDGQELYHTCMLARQVKVMDGDPLELMAKGRQKVDDKRVWLNATPLGEEDTISYSDGKTIKWRLNNWQDSSAKYGKCEVCGKHVSEVFGQHALIEYEPDEFTFYEAPENLAGHKECLLKARETGAIIKTESETESEPELNEPELTEAELLRLEIEKLETALDG